MSWCRPLSVFSLLAVVVASTPLFSLGVPDAGGCVRGVVFEGRPLRGGPARFCVEQVLGFELAEGQFVALRVAAPHRFEARVRSRVFVYRVEKDTLVPRFLGSGFFEREVRGLVALEGALGVEAVGASGRNETWSCTFEGFPLVCSLNEG